jgi:hypothetical protein
MNKKHTLVKDFKDDHPIIGPTKMEFVVEDSGEEVHVVVFYKEKTESYIMSLEEARTEWFEARVRGWTLKGSGQ